MNHRTFTALKNLKPSFMGTIALLVFLNSGLITASASAQNVNPTAKTKPLKPTKETIGISGFDSVAYFLEARAIKGSEEHSYIWKGKTWLFISKANKERFAKAPDTYVPSYDGCCAFALSEGKNVKGDPKVFRIRSGKLYLFHNEDKRDLFDKSPQQRLEKSESNFIKIFSTKF